jgi:hypothetical protein
MFYGIANNEAFWKERLSIFVALAPVTRLNNCGTPLLTWLAPIWKTVQSSLSLVGVYGFFDNIEDAFTTIACGLFPDLCNYAQIFLTTKDPSLDSTARYQVYMGHFPSGVSV